MEGFGLTFGGSRPPFELNIIEKNIGRIAPIRRKSIPIPGMPGAIPDGYETGSRPISLVVDFESDSKEEWLEKLKFLAAWFIREKPTSLRFDSEPGSFYMAELEGEIKTSEIGTYGQAILNFICNDPYQYTAKESEPFKELLSEDTQKTKIASIHNSGTIPVFPTVKAIVKEPITHLQIFDDERYFQIGESESVNTKPKQREERLLDDQLGSLVGWSLNTGQVDGGVVSGTMGTNGYSFGADDFGSGSSWHGPTAKAPAPQAPLTDFKVRLKFLHKNPNAGARGRIECYLLDEQSVDMGKFAMKRTGGGAYGNSIEARAGGGSDYKYFANYAGLKGIEWRDFEGLMEFSRIGDLWTVYTARVDPQTGEHTARATFTHRDIQKKFVRNLAQIQLHIAQSGTTEPTEMRISSLEVFRINPVTKEETAVIAMAGDELEMNFKTKKIYVNGEPRPDLKAFGSKFFSLPTGNSLFLIEPAGKVDATMEWEEGYL